MTFPLIFLISFWFSFSLKAQPQAISFEELELKMELNPKPVLIFLHTDWCNYCALMEKKTFSNQQVVEKLNTDFYFISFNAEFASNVDFAGKTYRFQKKGLRSGTHELAKTLSASGVYPSLIFLDKNGALVYEQTGYTNASVLLKLLNFF